MLAKWVQLSAFSGFAAMGLLTMSGNGLANARDAAFNAFNRASASHSVLRVGPPRFAGVHRSRMFKKFAHSGPSRIYVESNPQSVARSQRHATQSTRFARTNTPARNELQNTERELVDALQSQFRNTSRGRRHLRARGHFNGLDHTLINK